MKAMTCKELGGDCDTVLSAQTWDEMVSIMTEHVIAKHPHVVERMAKMHEEDPGRWSKEIKPKWNAAREV